MAAWDKYLSLSRANFEQRDRSRSIERKMFAASNAGSRTKLIGPTTLSGRKILTKHQNHCIRDQRKKQKKQSTIIINPATVAISLVYITLSTISAWGVTTGARDSFSALVHHRTFLPTQPTPSIAASISGLQLETTRCKTGAPLQWRPYLDAPSKAYLAPVVLLASLEHFALSPIQLSTPSILSGRSQQKTASQQQQTTLAQHAQSVNNVGVLIETTFQVRNLLTRRFPFGLRGVADLRPGKLVSLHYRVSASLATTSEMIALASSMDSQSSNQTIRQAARSTLAGDCPLELTEKELSKRGGDLFKRGRDYVLFVEPARLNSQQQHKIMLRQHQQPQQQPQQQQQVALQWWNAFASHEPVSNQTIRAVNRALCKTCVRAPTVRLVNTTLVSTATQQQQLDQNTRRRIKLDCRVSGFPAPWVEWFRNGKLLRNRSGRARIRTSQWKNKLNDRLSRLELELASGRNETGVYECRAMSVAAREPAVGTYTLLVLPGQFALFPMQQGRIDSGGAAGNANTAAAANNNNNSNGDLTNELDEQRRGQKSVAKANKTESTIQATTTAQQQQQQLAAQTASAGATVTTAASATTTTTTTLAPPQQQAGGGSSNSQTTGGAGSAAQQQQQQQQAHSAPPPRSGPTKQGGSADRQQQRASSKSSPVVVGQPCPGEAHDNFCLNRGACVLIGHIEEYFCNCSEGYHGHRCEYKSLGHQQGSH